MERTPYYLEEVNSYVFSFRIDLSFPMGIKDILQLSGEVKRLYPLSIPGGVRLTIEALFFFEVLTGTEERWEGEDIYTFQASLLEDLSLLTTLFSSTLEISTLFAKTMNQRGLITSIEVEVVVLVRKKELQRAPTLVEKRFLLKRRREEVREEVMEEIEIEMESRGEWETIKEIRAELKEIKTTTLKNRVLIYGEVELGIYYLKEGTLFLVYQNHPLYSLLEVEGTRERDSIDLEAYTRRIDWRDMGSILYVQLILSLHMVFSSKYQQVLPTIKGGRGRRFYLKAILEEGEQGFLLEREISFQKGSPLKIKRVVPDFILLEKRRLHRGIFFKGQVKIRVSYLNTEGRLIWETFSFSYLGEISTSRSRGEVELLSSVKEVLYDPSSGGLLLTIPLQIKYYLTREEPYEIFSTSDGEEIEALEYLGSRRENLLLRSLYSSLRPIQAIERLEAEPTIKRLFSFQGGIFIEGSIYYQVYYLSLHRDEQRYLSFHEDFQKEYTIEGVKKGLTIKAFFTLHELDYHLQTGSKDLKVSSFWEVEFLLCREETFSLSKRGERREGYVLIRRGEERRTLRDMFKERDLSVVLKEIERVEVEVLSLKALGPKVFMTYMYVFHTASTPISSKELFTEILLPVQPGHEDPLLLEERVLGVGFLLNRDEIQILSQFTLFYQHFTRDGG